MSAEIRESKDRDYMQIARAITRFNLANLPPHSSDNMTNLGYVITLPIVGVVGGVYGKLLLGNMLSIDVLWVEEHYRDRDFGTNLMRTIENVAKQLGSRISIVDTFDFQALDFYLKNGYEQFGVIDDCPCPGNKRYYLKKNL